MPVLNECKTNPPKLTYIDECDKCKQKPCKNGYCDCGSGKCMCSPGFTGLDCQTDICSSAACVKGVCSAKYLGGDLPVSINRCVCEEGWYKTFNLKKIKINKFLY